jgi:hypothetical protein
MYTTEITVHILNLSKPHASLFEICLKLNWLLPPHCYSNFTKEEKVREYMLNNEEKQVESEMGIISEVPLLHSKK